MKLTAEDAKKTFLESMINQMSQSKAFIADTMAVNGVPAEVIAKLTPVLQDMTEHIKQGAIRVGNWYIEQNLDKFNDALADWNK